MKESKSTLQRSKILLLGQVRSNIPLLIPLSDHCVFQHIGMGECTQGEFRYTTINHIESPNFHVGSVAN